MSIPPGAGSSRCWGPRPSETCRHQTLPQSPACMLVTEEMVGLEFHWSVLVRQTKFAVGFEIPLVEFSLAKYCISEVSGLWCANRSGVTSQKWYTVWTELTVWSEVLCIKHLPLQTHPELFKWGHSTLLTSYYLPSPESCSQVSLSELPGRAASGRSFLPSPCQQVASQLY